MITPLLVIQRNALGTLKGKSTPLTDESLSRNACFDKVICLLTIPEAGLGLEGGPGEPESDVGFGHRLQALAGQWPGHR